MKLLFIILLIVLFTVPALAEDLSPSGNLTPAVVIVVEPEPTIEYVFENVNLQKLSAFMDMKVAVNDAKTELGRSMRRIARELANVKLKYAAIADQCDGSTQALFEGFVPTGDAIVANLADFKESLDNVWSQYE